MSVILESVGLEYEFADFSQESIRRKLPEGWIVERDGSVTRDAYTLGGIPVSYMGMYNYPVRTNQIGGEAISPILSFEESDRLIEDLDTLMEIFKNDNLSDLTSIHVHIACGKYPSAKILKNLIKLAIGIESPMFRLSVGEQGTHRGVIHEDYMYCRPITGHGPQFVIDDHSGRWYYAFDLGKILAYATTSLDVIRGWCRADIQPNKWIPARYYWLHMASVWYRGTVELRLFNQTRDVRYIKAWVDLSHAFLRKAWSEEVILPEFGLGRSVPVVWNKPHFSFGDFVNIIRPDNFCWPSTIPVLEELWFKTDWQDACRPQANHLCTRRGKTVPMTDIPRDLRPELVSQQLIANLGEYARPQRQEPHRTVLNMEEDRDEDSQAPYSPDWDPD